MQAGAQLTPSRSRTNLRFTVNWTNSRKGTHSRSEINGSKFNRLRYPIAKARRPWRHGHCHRVPFAVAQSRIRNKEKRKVTASQTHIGRTVSKYYIPLARPSPHARSFTYRCAISSRRTSAGYHHRRCCIRRGLTIYHEPSDCRER